MVPRIQQIHWSQILKYITISLSFLVLQLTLKKRELFAFYNILMFKMAELYSFTVSICKIKGFGASGMHLSPLVAWAAVRSEAVVLLLLTFCLLLLPLWESVIVLVLLYVTLCPF